MSHFIYYDREDFFALLFLRLNRKSFQRKTMLISLHSSIQENVFLNKRLKRMCISLKKKRNIFSKVKADMRNLCYALVFSFTFQILLSAAFSLPILKLKLLWKMLEFIGFVLAEKCHICPLYLNQNHLAWIMFLMQRCTTLTWFYDRIAWPNMRVDMAELQ